MVKNYKFLEDVATADVAFEINADSLNSVFESAGLATFETMVELDGVGKDFKKEIDLEANSLDMLLFNFLEELIFLKDSESVVFSDFSCDVDESGKKMHAVVLGEKIDQEKHKLGIDVKAVTMHMFTIKKVDDGYYAMVILDI